VRLKTSYRDIGSNIAFISFNYDRSLEQFLYAWLSGLGIGEDGALEVLSRMKIFHPYGTLGPLPWQGIDGHRPFGQIQNLYGAASSIRTFTEQLEESEQLAQLRSVVLHAQRIVFLGFGFHRQNMTLLAPQKPTSHTPVLFGTTHECKRGEIQRISRLLENCFGRSLGVVESHLNCDQYMEAQIRNIATA
jgi:hypothetical protein